MQQKPPSNDYDRLRGWVLVSLYGSMAALCLMLIYALLMLQASFSEQQLEFYGTIAITAVAAIFNANAALSHYKLVKAGVTLPRLALKPFLFMAITLLFAGRLFGGL